MRGCCLSCIRSGPFTALGSQFGAAGLSRGGIVGNPDMGHSRLNLPAIETSLREVHDDFARINKSLSVPRDLTSDGVCENMMAGYRYVDHVLAEGLDLFDFGNSKHVFELTVLVLCGADADRREDCVNQMKFADKRFYEQGLGGVGDLTEWLQQRNGDGGEAHRMQGAAGRKAVVVQRCNRDGNVGKRVAGTFASGCPFEVLVDGQRRLGLRYGSTVNRLFLLG